MELILQQQLPHQQKAVDAIVDVFKDAYITAPTQFYTNPTFSLKDAHIANNIRTLQSVLPAEYRSSVPISESDYLNLDIKMETGTGKTYVYTKTILKCIRDMDLTSLLLQYLPWLLKLVQNNS